MSPYKISIRSGVALGAALLIVALTPANAGAGRPSFMQIERSEPKPIASAYLASADQAVEQSDTLLALLQAQTHR